MWRSLFIALGIMAIIVGIECLLIDSASFYSRSSTTAVDFLDPSGAPSKSITTWKPKEWFPWLVLSVGTLVVIYSFTIPNRIRHSSFD
ncbi:hypothetical protein [Stieleria varia]|uniref:Uncharacterized protein n=1 Tax=Stieleria varia TaxID=2528005 RepID=A0A5C6AX69_9BACT|nr:hypothetical protein [Stieleria varia]TWU04228.1 hypothetical protein Pla52n_22670 [Stieleria varia]